MNPNIEIEAIYGSIRISWASAHEQTDPTKWEKSWDEVESELRGMWLLWLFTNTYSTEVDAEIELLKKIARYNRDHYTGEEE